MLHAAPPLVRVAALVPVRGLEGAKARLGEALDAEERRVLVERLLRRAVAAALGTPGIVGVAVISPDPAVLELGPGLGAAPVAQRAGGLNEGLAEGLAWAEAAGADAILVVPGDLPAVSASELSRVIAAARAEWATSGVASLVAVVADRSGSGTNLLLVAPPGAIRFRFGEGSRAAHAAEARVAGAAYLELGGPLAFDLDTPDDLLAAEALGLDGARAPAP